MKICEICEKPLLSLVSTTKYCPGKCRAQAKRKKMKEYRENVEEEIEESLEWIKQQRKLLWGTSAILDASKISDVRSTLDGGRSFRVTL